jgi:hypothetical protein
VNSPNSNQDKSVRKTDMHAVWYDVTHIDICMVALRTSAQTHSDPAA